MNFHSARDFLSLSQSFHICRFRSIAFIRIVIAFSNWTQHKQTDGKKLKLEKKNSDFFFARGKRSCALFLVFYFWIRFLSKTQCPYSAEVEKDSFSPSLVHCEQITWFDISEQENRIKKKRKSSTYTNEN